MPGWLTGGAVDELLDFPGLHPPDHMQSHEVAILIRRTVAGGSETICLLPFQPDNGGYGYRVRDVYLHAVTVGIAD